MTVEFIKYQGEDHDEWTCLCGNTLFDKGFLICDAEGNAMEPEGDSDWNLHVCGKCGRIFKQETLEVVGRKK